MKRGKKQPIYRHFDNTFVKSVYNEFSTELKLIRERLRDMENQERRSSIDLSFITTENGLFVESRNFSRKAAILQGNGKMDEYYKQKKIRVRANVNRVINAEQLKMDIKNRYNIEFEKKYHRKPNQIELRKRIEEKEKEIDLLFSNPDKFFDASSPYPAEFNNLIEKAENFNSKIISRLNKLNNIQEDEKYLGSIGINLQDRWNNIFSSISNNKVNIVEDFYPAWSTLKLFKEIRNLLHKDRIIDFRFIGNQLTIEKEMLQFEKNEQERKTINQRIIGIPKLLGTRYQIGSEQIFNLVNLIDFYYSYVNYRFHLDNESMEKMKGLKFENLWLYKDLLKEIWASKNIIKSISEIIFVARENTVLYTDRIIQDAFHSHGYFPIIRKNGNKNIKIARFFGLDAVISYFLVITDSKRNVEHRYIGNLTGGIIPYSEKYNNRKTLKYYFFLLFIGISDLFSSLKNFKLIFEKYGEKSVPFDFPSIISWMWCHARYCIKSKGEILRYFGKIYFSEMNLIETKFDYSTFWKVPHDEEALIDKLLKFANYRVKYC